MSRLSGYWLVFVVVAVGLILSWGQVGYKARDALDNDPVRYLSVEPDCRPMQVPCAAVTGDHALILGPARNGLRLVQTGLEPGKIRSVEASGQQGRSDAAEDSAKPVPVYPAAEGWSLVLPVPLPDVLRIRLITDGAASVADFPL
jgi:hypothetical protein